MNNMARFIIDGITIEQAKELAHWYEGQGEQEASGWFECQDGGIEAPMTEMDHEPSWINETKDEVTIYCK